MKKKELKERLPKKWPDHNTAKIIRADGKLVLMILLPEWEKKDPGYKYGYVDAKGIVHFVWGNGYGTYYPKSGVWTNESLDWLHYKSRLTVRNEDEKSIKAIHRYTGYVWGDISAVECMEAQIRDSKKRQALERKQKRINELMRSTPALPKNFRGFCVRKKTEAGQDISVKLFQPLSNGKTIERIFKVEQCNGWHRGAYSEGLKGIRITEICRAYTDEYGDAWNDWYYGEISFEYGRKQTFWDRKSGSCVNVLPKKNYIYDNLDQLDMTQAQRSVLRIMDGKDDPSIVLNQLHFHPATEQVIKARLFRFSVEMRIYGKTEEWIQRLGCLSGTQRKRLAKYDGGIGAWKLLKLFPKITDRNLEEFCLIKSEAKVDKILSFLEDGLNMNHLFTLWRATGGIRMETLQRYRDYIEMARRRGNNIREEIIYRDKRWRQRHNQYVEEWERQREEEDKKKNKAKWDKWKAISRDYKRNKRIFAWEKDGYCIIVPKSAEEINEEGRRQHHCVGSQEIYKTDMALRRSYIVFLRKKEAPDEPYYTIEVDEKKVVQFYGAYDRKPDEKTVSGLLQEWMKQVRKNFEKEKKREKRIVKAVSQKVKAVAAG